ncbi:MAG: hypothetical protein RMJ98_05290 [Myxococcales bacterium]|nr:hypothetical protein [Polyangiaceae bacterium]MDW8248704.1 hypothetical protein [Myxococcales bacterium]
MVLAGCNDSRWGLVPGAFLVASLIAAPARAQMCPPTGTAPSLCRNDFAIDLYQGPVLAPLRVMALGGAYSAMASGVDGLGQNTASAAVRLPYSFSTFDYDVSLSVYLPGAFGKTDFDNRGEVGLNSFAFFYSLGAQVQWGPWGLAALLDFQRYTLAARPGSNLPPAVLQIGRMRVAGGAMMIQNQATLGVGLRGVRATVAALASSSQLNKIFLPPTTNLLSMTGVSPEVGLVLHPDYVPWRLGVTYRLPVSASGSTDTRSTVGSDGVRRAAGLALPSRVEWPWELEVGIALSAGPRPLNPRWIDPRDHEISARQAIDEARAARRKAREMELASLPDPIARHERYEELQQEEFRLATEENTRLADLRRLLEEERKARYDNWPRPRILVLADLLLTGSTPDGIGLQSFLRQEDVPSGSSVTYQPRLGIEGEPVLNRMMARVGTYLEPSRYQIPEGSGFLAGARQHFTFGLEVRAFTSSLWGLVKTTQFTINLAGDLAPRYQNLGISLGTWH